MQNKKIQMNNSKTLRQRLPLIFVIALLMFFAPLGGISMDKASAVVPISVSRVLQALNFGRIVADSLSGGTVVIDASTGNKTVSGGLTGIIGGHGRGVLEVTGDPSREFTITLPTELIISGKVGGGVQTMRLTNFTSSPSSTGITGPDGRAIVFIGATATLIPGQPGSIYNNAVNVFVDYVGPA